MIHAFCRGQAAKRTGKCFGRAYAFRELCSDCEILDAWRRCFGSAIRVAIVSLSRSVLVQLFM